MSLNQSFISDFSEYYRWSQRTKIKYKLHYGWCTGRRFTAATRHNTSHGTKLLVTRKGKYAWTNLISSRIRLLTFELYALEWQIFYTFELEYLWGELANLDQILCVASLGVMFWGRLDQNSGVHGNRNPPLTYNEENGVSTFSRLLLIRSFVYLQVTRTCIKSRTSSNFSQIGPLTTELAALELLKKFP